MKHANIILAATVLWSPSLFGRDASAQTTKPTESLVSAQNAQNLAQDATASALVRLISAGLAQQQRMDMTPPEKALWTWNVLYQPQHNIIKVQRGQAVLVPPSLRGIGVSDKDIKPVLGHPAFGFQVQPFVSPADYRRFKAENAAIFEQIGKLDEQMKDIKHDYNSSKRYMPEGEEQRKRVEAYNGLWKSLHQLPDFYFQNISLSWLWFSPDGLIMSRPLPMKGTPSFIRDGQQGWQREQSDAAKISMSLLSRYEPIEK